MTEQIEKARRKALCEAIGQMTLSWSRLELVLDGVVSLLHVFWQGEQFERQIPRSLNRKIKFVRSCFTRLPAFQNGGHLVVEVMEEIEALSERRHWCIHGALHRIEPNGLIRFKRTRVGSSPPKIEDGIISFEEINKVSKDAYELSNTLMIVFEKLSYFLDESDGTISQAEGPEDLQPEIS